MSANGEAARGWFTPPGALMHRILAGCSMLLAGVAPARGQSAPTNFQATVDGPTQVTLSWNAVAGTTGYHVWRALGAAGFVRLTGSKIPATSYTDVSAMPNTTYRYKGMSVDAAGMTYSSAIVTVTTPGASTPVATATKISRPASVAVSVLSSPTLSPPAGNPTNFTAELRGNQVVLSWRLVAGVSWYLLGGPGMGANGRQVQLPYSYVDGLAAGQHEWTVASLSEDRKPLTDLASWPKAQLTIPTMPASGRYRISIAGFKVNHETFDDPLERDGKRDEVFTAVVVQHFNRKTGALADAGTVQSKVYGDANGFPDRVPQGRASDVGGLMTGDVAPFGWDEQAILPSPNPGWFPLVLWEGSLANDEDALVLRPTIWEWDGDRTGFNTWLRKVTEDPGHTWNFNPLQQTVTSAAIGEVESDISTVGTSSVWYHQHYQTGDGSVNAGRDRPIGLTRGGWWPDRLLLLTREKIESELSKSGTIGGARGLLPLGFVDGILRNTDPVPTTAALSGDYTVYLRLERVP